MNFLHSRYQKSGNITNDDLLYPLSIFALELARWINWYEWRNMTYLEMCACGTFWKSMGEAMEISYAKLPASTKGWKDGLHFLEEVKEWSDDDEENHMVPADTNRQLAESQFNYMLPEWPARYRDPCVKMIVVLLGDRLRRSMMYVSKHIQNLLALLMMLYRYSQSSSIYHQLVNGFLDVRRLLIRHLALPRPDFLRNHWIESRPDSRHGRYALYDYLAHPWYVKPTPLRHRRPGAWITRLLGYKVPGDDGDKYFPQGYNFADVGPTALGGEGIKEMEETRSRLVQGDRGGCPFAPA
jgi:hypothetical protein